MATQLKPDPAPQPDKAPSAAAHSTSVAAAPVAPIIVKRIIVEGHGGHHGGGWKVAYADFATAMMTFFLLLWILGATTEDQRKGIADYFAPTLVQMQNSGGSNGVMGGRSIIKPDGNAPHATPAFRKHSPVAPSSPGDAESFDRIEKALARRIRSDPALAALERQVRLTRTPTGLEIELIDRAGFSMFALGTPKMVPRARALIMAVGESIRDAPHALLVRGHTDNRRYADPSKMNNWLLSSQRAEETRQTLERAGVTPARFARIEGVADRQPFVPADPADPRNRRITITLLPQDPPAPAAQTS